MPRKITDVEYSEKDATTGSMIETKNIIVSGDSWSLGEWSSDSRFIMHGGVSQFLHDHGFNVINLGQSSSSNRETLLRVTNFFRHNQHITKSDNLIVIFQAEWTRDFPYFIDEDSLFFHDPIQLRDRLVSRFYYDLSSLSTQFGVKIKVLGGSGDAIFIENFDQIYSGVSILCQSITNFLVNGTGNINDPIFSTYSAQSSELVGYIKKHIKDDKMMEDLMRELDKGQSRVDTFSKNPDMFYPDGGHPNRQAHKLLFDYMIERIDK